MTDNLIKTMELKSLMDSLLDSKRYIDKSEYQEQVREYCESIDLPAAMEELIEQHNERYIAEAISRT